MENTNNNPLEIMQGKDSEKLPQIQQVKQAFFIPKTMKEADAVSGVMRENICRYVKTLKESNQIFLIAKRRCKVTGWNNVGVYTTNVELAKDVSNQLNLFGNE